MDRRAFIRSASIVAVSLASAAKAQQPSVTDVGEQLEALRKEHGFPGIAAAAVRGGQVVAEGVAGVRRVGNDDKIMPDDRFAMASCTKKMTAAMIARVIDSGKLSFDTTLADALPDMPMRDDYRGVTVAQLLTFTGGLRPYLQVSEMLTPILFQLKGTAAEQREQFIKHVVNEEPIVKPGTESRYSNASYGLVGFVAEQRTGKSWEALMQSEVFQPLGMTTAGFGTPRSKDRPNEPTLHNKTDTGFEPEADDRVNVLEAFAPAGNVHCSIRDFAKFAAYELAAAQGHNSLLNPATAQRLRELSRPAAPGGKRPPMKTGAGELQPGKADGDKAQTAKGQRGKAPPGAGSAPAFFGGSQFVSAGCILWPQENLSVVAAINAGSCNDAIRAAHEALRQFA
jgi:CubicO group peptidase (beta-lactamase class C family)